jgi:hypothetical protein
MNKIIVLTITFLSIQLSTFALLFDNEQHQGRKINNDKYASKVNWNSLKEGLKKAAIKKPMTVDFAVYEGYHE